MADVYSLATVTILAAAADHCNGGLAYGTACRIFDGSEEARQLVQLDLTGGLLLEGETRTLAPKTAINTRAWTLQEQILSLRILLFTSNGLGWLRGRGRVLPPGSKRDIPGKYNPLLFLRKEEPLQKLSQDLMSSYTRRKLSKPEDKLPALATVARTIHTLKHVNYLAGLWEENLLAQLTWKTNDTSVIPRAAKRRPPGYRAPSWSWMSLDAAVSLRHEQLDADNPRLASKIESCCVSLVDPKNPFGQVMGGVLTIRGPTVRVTRVQGEGNVPSDSGPECYAMFGQREYQLGHALFDTPRDEAETRLALEASLTHIVALFIRHNSKTNDTYGLILSATSKEKGNQYRRIGALHWGNWRPDPRIPSKKLPFDRVMII